jgi:hypothetical protein
MTFLHNLQAIEGCGKVDCGMVFGEKRARRQGWQAAPATLAIGWMFGAAGAWTELALCGANHSAPGRLPSPSSGHCDQDHRNAEGALKSQPTTPTCEPCDKPCAHRRVAEWARIRDTRCLPRRGPPMRPDR